MRILFFSDVHGSAGALGDLTLRIAGFQPELIVLLGDALYHGPRNALPGEYDTKRAAEMLNVYQRKIAAVRGNCDCEVDQMLLKFPVLADYSTLFADGQRFFLTHGHLWNEGNPPPATPGTILAHGHTHVPVLKDSEDGSLVIFNPGSISIPKQMNPPSYGTWEDGVLSVRELKTGNIFRGMTRKF